MDRDERRPLLVGERVTVRPGGAEDVDALLAIRTEPGVVQWWGPPDPRDGLEAELRGTDDGVLLVQNQATFFVVAGETGTGVAG